MNVGLYLPLRILVTSRPSAKMKRCTTVDGYATSAAYLTDRFRGDSYCSLLLTKVSCNLGGTCVTWSRVIFGRLSSGRLIIPNKSTPASLQGRIICQSSRGVARTSVWEMPRRRTEDTKSEMSNTFRDI